MLDSFGATETYTEPERFVAVVVEDVIGDAKHETT